MMRGGEEGQTCGSGPFGFVRGLISGLLLLSSGSTAASSPGAIDSFIIRLIL
jgi:hypothetical protein